MGSVHFCRRRATSCEKAGWPGSTSRESNTLAASAIAQLSSPDRSPALRLEPSKIHGVGLFAAAPFAHGMIVPLGPDIFCARAPLEDLSDVAPWVREELQRRYLFDDKIQLVPVYGLRDLSFAQFINHSTEPNVKIESGKCLALRDICAGEEILLDYRTFASNSYCEASPPTNEAPSL
eukprot:gnl/MRDRNA2_/MRDRNA2_126560_c0_seq1.p1 gnl/MRDRNA2_/MRDRNA2_126560_c0~~gnl/MRDRNA2_/MRDRNA2_126560_c0_seq1.p1  ORF type:complete len:178 (+),score=30.12 gnl/MRDRNA2_/MRDRNA2_126560_c0_seq1:71-604(+)